MEIALHKHQYMKEYLQIQLNLDRSLPSRRVKCIIEILRENSVHGVLLSSFLFRQQGGDQFQQQRAFHLAKEGGRGRLGWKLGRMTRRFSKGYTLVWKLEIVKHNIIALQKKSLHYFFTFLL